MQVSYIIYSDDDEIHSSGVTDIIQAQILLTSHIIKGRTVVMEAMDDDSE